MSLSTKSLEETLSAVDIGDASSLGLKIIDYSPPNEQLNDEVYNNVNKVLRSGIRKSALDCTHITGEMRALADPNHRNVIRKNWRSYKRRVDLVCFLPTEYRSEGSKVWAWNRRNWTGVDWKDQLDAYDLLGEAGIRLYALKRREEIHYSVFFDKFVLLQSRHTPPSHAKHVWLIESVTLTERLRKRAQQIVDRAERISPKIFKELCLSLSSPQSLDCLFTLREEGIMKMSRLNDHLKKISQPPFTFLKDLFAVGFITQDETNLRITPMGQEYMALWL